MRRLPRFPPLPTMTAPGSLALQALGCALISGCLFGLLMWVSGFPGQIAFAMGAVWCAGGAATATFVGRRLYLSNTLRR